LAVFVWRKVWRRRRAKCTIESRVCEREGEGLYAGVRERTWPCTAVGDANAKTKENTHGKQMEWEEWREGEDGKERDGVS
jgi:hypothetical protein